MAEENRGTHKLYEKDRIGEVQIADEVVAIIAGLAATEIDGVDSMAGNITNELVGKLGIIGLYHCKKIVILSLFLAKSAQCIGNVLRC